MNAEFISNPTGNVLTRIWRNKHTSGAAAVYLAAKYGTKLGAIWIPSHAAQFVQTGDIIESMAVGYGLFAAGDSSPTPPTSTLDEKADPKKGA